MISYSRNLFTGQILSELEGDKLLLPPFVLEEILRAGSSNGVGEDFITANYNNNSDFSNTHLPYPIVFQIFNPKTRLITYGGVLEFNAADEKAYLPQWMYDSLSLKEGDEITIRLKELPKGTWVRFRPMTMDYKDIKDYRAAFEAYLRSYYTTLTAGEILTIKQADNSYQFLVDSLKPAEAVQIVDTDLEVEITPLLEDLKINRNQSNSEKPANKKKNSVEKEMPIIGELYSGVVSSREYEYWNLKLNSKNIDKSCGISIKLICKDGDADLIVSNERNPTIDDHLWSDFSSTSITNEKNIVIPPTNYEYSVSDELYIGIYGFSESATSYELTVTPFDPAISSENSISSLEETNDHVDEIQCKNCGHWIPQQTVMLHTNFCERNNKKCDLCGKIIKKGEEKQHWHCDKCDKNGDISEKDKHELIFHTPRKCSCKYETESLQELARHKRTTCPDRLITCRFCRNLVKQGEPSTNQRDLLEGLTVHESYCGSRTITCVKCGESVTLRNVKIHDDMHEIEKQNQRLPKLCRNENCIRPAADNILKLCTTCFGPFWSPTADPTGRMLYTRLGRKYYQQLTVGCGNNWCTNMYCATGSSTKQDPNTAASKLLPHLQQIQTSVSTTPLYLCVDELTNRRRRLANILYKGEDVMTDDENVGRYPIEFCVKAIEIENEDLIEARKWLQANAPNEKGKNI